MRPIRRGQLAAGSSRSTHAARDAGAGVGWPTYARSCQIKHSRSTPCAILAGMPVPVDQLLLFLGGSILITIVPGPDMALVFRQVLLGGTRLAQRTIFGNLSGLVVHAVALAAGLSALLATSAEAYTVVKLAGAAYLFFLGIQTLLAARRRDAEALEAAASGGVAAAHGVPSPRTAYF